MAGCRRIWITENSISILSGNFEFHKYTRDGKFKFKIAKEGKGKGEIFWIKDFSPGPKGSIYILGYKEYYHYSSQGTFLNSIPLERPYKTFNPDQFHIINDTFQLFSTSSTGAREEMVEKFSHIVFDKTRKKYNFKLYRHTCIIGYNSFLQWNNDIIIAPINGVDTIHIWKENQVRPLYYIDFGQYKTNPILLPLDYNLPHTALYYAQQNRLALNIYNTFMNHTWLMFIFYFHNNYFFCAYNLLTQEQYTQALVAQSGNILTSGYINAVYDDKFYLSIPAHKVTELIENKAALDFLPEKRRLELLNKLKSVKETDNPVLMVIKTKDN